MKYWIYIVFSIGLLVCSRLTAFCEDDPSTKAVNIAEQEKQIDTILSRIEKRYQGSGFTADFFFL